MKTTSVCSSLPVVCPGGGTGVDPFAVPVVGMNGQGKEHRAAPIGLVILTVTSPSCSRAVTVNVDGGASTH